MRTLIGGIVPLSIPGGRFGCSGFFLLFFARLAGGRGEAILAGGGVLTRACVGSGAGGVGRGGAGTAAGSGGGMPDFSEEFESVR